jgi:uncharacterized SAM-binding protein YcdF (DUF218 family)
MAAAAGRRGRALRVIGAAAILALLTAAFTPLPNAGAQWLAVPARLEPADAIVVLAASAYPDGTLSPSSLHRAVHGIALRRRDLAPLLVLSGSPPSPGSDEAAARRTLARQMGVPPEGLVTVTGPTTTREEAVQIRALLGGRRTILLVTSSAHMPRARRAFERVGFTVFPAPADTLSPTAHSPSQRLNLAQQVVQEVVARAYYRAAGFF